MRTLAGAGKPPKFNKPPIVGFYRSPPLFNKPPLMAAPPGSGTVVDTSNDIAAQIAAAIQASGPAQSLQIPLPISQPPVGATLFDIAGSLNVSAAGWTTIPGTQLQVPDGCIAVIRTFNIGTATNITTATQQNFLIRFNGGPAAGALWPFTYIGRAAQNLEQPFDVLLISPSGALIDVQVNDVDGGSYLDFATYTGWYMSETLALRWIQGQANYAGF